MNDNETISALVDGELSVDEARATIDKLLQDAEAMKRWRRYHLIRDSLQGYRASSDRAYADVYTNAIDEHATGEHDGEEAPLVFEAPKESTKPAREPASREFRAWATGFAMAAAVATVVVFGLRLGDQTGPNQTGPIAPTVVGDASIVSVNEVDDSDQSVRWEESVSARRTNWTRPGEPVVASNQARLNALLVRHGEHISVSGLNGLSGYARFVSFDDSSR